MNKVLIAACLASTLGACASTPSASTAASASARPADCVQVAPPSWASSACQNASVYTRQEWQTKGATNTADALRQVAVGTGVH